MKKLLVLMLVVLFVVSLLAETKNEKSATSEPTVEQLIQEGKYQEAIDLGLKHISSGQVTAGLLVNIGVAYYKMKDYDNAINYLEQAFSKASDPLAPDTDLQQKTLLFETAIYHEKNEENKVVEVYERLLQIFPENKEILSSYAELLEKKDPKKAFEIYDKLVSLNPDYGYDAGVFAMQQNDLTRAETYLNAAKSVKPEDENVLLALTKLYLQEKKYQETIPVLEKVLVVTTKDYLKPKLLYFLASCQLEVKKPLEAIATCDKILAIRANDEHTLVLKAKAYRVLKDAKNAISAADQALLVNPENEEANYIRAKLAIEQKDYRKAISLCEKVIALTKNEERKKEVQTYIKEMKGRK